MIGYQWVARGVVLELGPDELAALRTGMTLEEFLKLLP